MSDRLCCKRFRWLRLLAVAASLSAILARADDPIRTGIHNSVRQAGPMVRSLDGTLRPHRRLPFEIVRVSGEEADPALPAAEPVAEPALVRIDDVPPPVPAPPAAASPATSSDSMISGVAEVRYISSAWPGTWRPSDCSDISFQPLGASVAGAMGRQIFQGAVELMTLYNFDFYRAETERQSELTERGLYQLQKYARRLEFVPAAIKVEIAESNPALDAARREHVVAQLGSWGVPNADSLVVLGRARFGVSGSEAVQTAEGLERVIDTRGRSVTPDTSARFGTGRGTSGFAR